MDPLEFSGVGALTLFVADLRQAASWYERAFARPVVHQDDDSIAFGFGNVVVNLLNRSAAGELIEPHPVGEAGPGTHALLTISVDDTDAAVHTLRERGVDIVNGPIDRPWGVRTACVADPDGHHWELAQPRRATEA